MSIKIITNIDLNKSSFEELTYKLSNNLIDIRSLTILQKILILNSSKNVN